MVILELYCIQRGIIIVYKIYFTKFVMLLKLDIVQNINSNTFQF